MIARRGKTGRRRAGGAAAVELAMVLPFVVTIVLGHIESARMGMVAQLLTTAAREGCRVAVLNGKTQADVQARVQAVLAGSGVPIGTVTPTPEGWQNSSGGTAITVSLSVPFSQVSWLPTPLFLKGAKITASATMSSERP